MVRRVLFWPVFVALLILSLYGLVSERLFNQQVWEHDGLVRLAWFTGACGVWVLAVRVLRPRWLVRATLAAVLVGCVLVAGARAPLAVLFLFTSAWALGTLFALDGVLALLAGLCLYVFLVGLAVHAPLNYPSVYAFAFIIPLVWQWKRLLSAARQWNRRLEQLEPAGTNRLWPVVLLGFILLMHLVIVLGPEVSADGLAMHLAVPASVHAHHQFTFDVRHTTWAVLPMAGDWGFTAAYLLGGEAAARLFNFGMLLSAAALVFTLARRMLPDHLSILSTTLFVSSPMVQLVTGSLFVENFWAALMVGAVAALACYAEGGEKRYALASAVLLGSGLATKFGTLAYLAPVLILLGWELWQRRALRLLPAVVAVVLLFGAPPYLRALALTGNPVFPFLNHVFRSPYFESATPLVDTRFPTPPAATALFDLTFRTGRLFEGQNGGWTFCCFLFVPLAVLLLRPRHANPGWLALAVALPAAALTLTSQGNARYLYPAVPLCAVAAAAVLADLKSRGAGCYRATLAVAVAAVLLNIYFLPASGTYHKQFFVLGKDQVERYLAAGAPSRRIIAWLNEVRPGEPALFVGINAIDGLTGRAFTTTWHTAAFFEQIQATRSPGQCRELLARLGIRSIVTPADPKDIGHVALRRMVIDSTRADLTYAGWQVRTLAEVPQPVVRQPSALPRGTYDDMDARIEFLGPWESGRFPAAVGGTVTYSNGPGSLFRAAFEGSGIVWVYTRAPNRGLAEVRVDGVQVGVIDLYSKEPEWRIRTRFRSLGAGPHVIEVRVLGKKAAAATDCFIDLDELVVE